MAKFNVTVRAAGNPDFTTTVDASDEWKARTRAMFAYPHKLTGQLVEFVVVRT